MLRSCRSACAGAWIPVLLSIALACGDSRERDAPPAAPQQRSEAPERPTQPATFVGGAACAGCHPEEFERWVGSHHDLAMQEANETSLLGDFDGAELTHFGVTTRFFRRDDGFWVRTEGPDGELHDYEIAYAFGVEPLQQVLIPFPGGRLQALGIAWDSRPTSAGGQRWFPLYPDEPIPAGDPLHWTGPNQTWNYMCAECHSTNLRKGYQLEADRYDTTWSELDVSCEACHGPGSAHLAWAAGGAAGSDPGLVVRFPPRREDDWSFAPEASIAHRTRSRESDSELQICARCHSRRALIYEDYAYGPLLDTHRLALLDEDLYYADGQPLDEVYVTGSFLQSRMHAAGVSCSDCHDPHSLAPRAEGNALCGACHRPERFDTPDHHFHEAGTAGALCVSCHMTTQTLMVLDERRDHGFRIPRPALAARVGAPDPCTSCHADRTAEWADAVIAERLGGERSREPHFGDVFHAARTGEADAEVRLRGLVEDAGQPAIVRASALRLLRERLGPSSRATVERALEDPDPLVRLAALEASDAVDARRRLLMAQPRLRDPIRAVRIEAARVLASVPAELWSPAARTALAEVLPEYRAAQAARAERPEAHVSLGNLHAAFGELDEARAEYETALRLDPRFVPAWVNLADLERLAGRDEAGERALRQALAVDDRVAETHHALGLLLVRQKRMDEALEALARATELAPDNTRFLYVYGVALQSAGRSEAALEVLERAHRQSPGDLQPLLALATIHRDRGDRDAALLYARRLAELAPDDPGARALLRELESAAESEPGLATR